MAATATPAEEAIVIALHQLEASADQVSFELPGVTFRIHRHFRWGYDCCGGVLAYSWSDRDLRRYRSVRNLLGVGFASRRKLDVPTTMAVGGARPPSQLGEMWNRNERSGLTLPLSTNSVDGLHK